MNLYPALRINGAIIKGQSDDSHNTLATSHKLSVPEESTRGFTPDGKLFLTRKQALGWLKANDIKTFRKLPSKAHYIGLHSEHLANAYDIKQKPEAIAIIKEAKSVATKVTQQGTPQTKSDDTRYESDDLSDKTVLVWDRGLYLFMAEKLVETYKKVYYYIPQTEPYPCSKTKLIGTGLGVERVYEFWPYVDKADLLVFPDCYDGELQHYLRSKGHLVFGNGRGEKLEMDKVFFLETLESVGLPVSKTYRAEGLDDLTQYLEKHPDPAWLKTSYYRGDFETKKFVNMKQIQPWIDQLRMRIGKNAENIEILVQDKIDSEIEVGYDGFCVDGKFSDNCITGYEIKDKGFIASITDNPPPMVNYVNDKISPVLKKLGYRGHFSTEIRVTKDFQPYFIDPTCRLPSPPSELMVELYSNYSQIVWDVANGKIPIPEFEFRYGAEIILTSESAEDAPLCVNVPRNIRRWVKLKNHMKDGNAFYCLPNGNAQFIGAVVAIGDSVEEVTKKVIEYVEQIEADDLEVDPTIFDKAQEQVDNGIKFGINFGGNK